MFISIEKERKKKHLARRLSSVIILFNTVINVYITYGQTLGQPNIPGLTGYYIFLIMEVPLARVARWSSAINLNHSRHLASVLEESILFCDPILICDKFQGKCRN